jgi:hypothetical protein
MGDAPGIIGSEAVNDERLPRLNNDIEIYSHPLSSPLTGYSLPRTIYRMRLRRVMESIKQAIFGYV